MSHFFFELHCFTSLAGGIDNAEATLDKYLSNSGPHSVLLAINDDPTLQRTVDYARLRGWRVYGVAGEDTALMLTAVIDLEADSR